MVGRMIALEGGEGCGKSTQARLLAERLMASGREVVLTREPGGSPGAEEIRKLLVTGDPERWDADAEALLFIAARADHIARTILPALRAGKWVVSDRFVLSNYAYQGDVRGFGVDRLQALHRITFGPFRELLGDVRHIILDIDPAVGLARSATRRTDATRFEQFGPTFHADLRAAYLKLGSMFRVVHVVDAGRMAGEVADDVFRIATG